MSRLLASVAVVLGLALASPALAAKVQIDVTPQTLPHIDGLEICAVQRDDETIGFTVTRDPSKAQWQGRSGLLEISNGQGDAVECYVQGEKKGDKIEFWFAVAPRHMEGATFTLIEVQTDPSVAEGAEQLIGGGTYYRFRLSDFDDQVKVACPVSATDIEAPAEVPAAEDSMRRRPAPAATDIDGTRDEIRALLVLHEHDAKYGEGVLSVGIEIENASISQYARVEYDPRKLKLELVDGDGKAVAVLPALVSGPAPQGQVAVIPPGACVVFSTHYPGVGISVGDRRLLAVERAWSLSPGAYRLSGSATFRTSFGRATFDESRPDIALPPVEWPADQEIELKFPGSTFSAD